MLFIGIDVAKTKHDCCIIDSDGIIYTDSLRISNTKEGFDKLYSTIISCLDLNGLDDVKIGLESTDHYSTNITNYLYSKGFQVHILNPLSTKKLKQIKLTPKSLQRCCSLMNQNPILIHHIKFRS